MGLKSGYWLGHYRTLMCFFLSHSFVALAMCFGSLSCWNTHPWPIFNALAGFKALTQSIVPLMQCSCSVPLAEKHLKAECFHLRFWWWGWCSWGQRQHSSSSKHGELSWCQRARFLVSSDPNTFTQFSSESLANFIRACTCAFLSSETLRALHDFSPSRRSVTNCFLGDDGPSFLEIIDQIRSCSSGLIPHRSHDQSNSTRWDLAWSPSPREIDSYFVFLPFVYNRTNCCHLLTKLLGDGLAAHSSLV